jgi:hypothetical protein
VVGVTAILEVATEVLELEALRMDTVVPQEALVNTEDNSMAAMEELVVVIMDTVPLEAEDMEVLVKVVIQVATEDKVV